MRKKHNKIILFDLGDTLIYRERPIMDFDISLINEISKIDSSTIKNTILEVEKKYQGIYKHWLDNEKCNTLENEYKYIRSFFTDLFEELGTTNKLDDFLSNRKQEIRYKLFNKAEQYLELLSVKYDLGIITNGRPSRRDVIKQLKIDLYFNNNLIFISDEIGHSKPDKSFFDFVIKEVGKDTQIIICDDEDRNIEYAKKIGWDSYKIDQKELGFKVLDILK